MKKLIIPILMLLPIMAQAQSVLTPQQQLEQAQKQLEEAKKAVEAAKKAKQAAEEAARKAAENAKIQEQTKAMQEEAARLNAEAERIKAEAQKQATDSSKGWEVPKAATVTKVEKKAATNANGEVLKDDPKYLANALSYDENGKIVFTLTTDANGKSAAQIYDLVYGYMSELTQGRTTSPARWHLSTRARTSSPTPWTNG